MEIIFAKKKKNQLDCEERNSHGEINSSESLTEISLSFFSSVDNSSEPKKDIVLSGFGDKMHDDSQSRTCGSHGWVSVIGKRREMEDAVKVELEFVVKGSEKYDFFGVYDGHGGARVAEACRERLHRVLEEETMVEGGEGINKGRIDWEKVIEEGFERMDEEVSESRRTDRSVKMMGSTAVVAVVGKDIVVVANCGDSRAVISRGGVVVPLSIDPKPDRLDELERIKVACGRVINWNGHRILGVLATSRSIGDQYLKSFVISKAEVTINEQTDADEFLILASDGLWDVISNEVACQVVRKYLKIRREFVHEKCAAKAASILAKLAMARGSKDNISVIVIELKKQPPFC